MQVVLTGDQIAWLDRWRSEQPDQPSRSEAMRRMIDFALADGGERPLRYIADLGDLAALPRR